MPFNPMSVNSERKKESRRVFLRCGDDDLSGVVELIHQPPLAGKDEFFTILIVVDRQEERRRSPAPYGMIVGDRMWSAYE